MDTANNESNTRQATVLQAVITVFDEESKHIEPACVNELVDKDFVGGDKPAVGPG